jgi:mannosyl-3-phosphoglycerate phosphatase
MTIRVVLTDLDGTVLEPDGTMCPEARHALADLVAAGVPVCPVTSKTVAELTVIMDRLGVTWWAGFENGAGVTCAGQGTELLPSAVPFAKLREVFAALRRRTAAPARSLPEIGDDELAILTGLHGSELAGARTRVATLPLVVEREWDTRLEAALPAEPRLRLLRGDRFLHLQGGHSKADVVARLLTLAAPEPGIVVACGDAPNDVELLARADVAVIVPGEAGPNPVLWQRFPEALVAPLPNGRGWAATIGDLLANEGSGARDG